MPRFDATGPFGMGPMTGRGVGYCAGINRVGSPIDYTLAPYGWGRRRFGRFGCGRGFGRGFGRGRGRGFGRRFW